MVWQSSEGLLIPRTCP